MRALDWEEGSDLIGCDDPAEVEAAFERGERFVGIAVMGLALCVPDAGVVEPFVVRALRSDRVRVRLEGLTALSHMVRINGEVDRATLDLLRGLLKSSNPEVKEHADTVAGDVWIFVPHRRLPAWLWVRATIRRVRWWLVLCWWTITRKYR
ncbi:hypothetical protein Sru01_18360 [Sphaerisporangium rufum]|uniref:Uncharacterized protein n=1 Tax=Sphaerisporangium rufum TaxID=1381558 RepID=A0A919QZ57_9ACTN|nr:hypothetical protein [Sphaerisporangium rufum]GII76854.1 hypothetical protein Sru01_18360 [Sphaerisporangium rufum]